MEILCKILNSLYSLLVALSDQLIRPIMNSATTINANSTLYNVSAVSFHSQTNNLSLLMTRCRISIGHTNINTVKYTTENRVIPDRYKKPKWLPATKREWIRLIDKVINEKYKSELETFLKAKGQIIAMIFGHDELMRRHKRNSYQGLLDELKWIYTDNAIMPSTKRITKSINVLLNSTQLDWRTGHASDRMEGDDSAEDTGDKRCPFCGDIINGNIAVHLVRKCSVASCPDDMQWNEDQSSFAENISFLEAMQLKIERHVTRSEVGCNTD